MGSPDVHEDNIGAMILQVDGGSRHFHRRDQDLDGVAGIIEGGDEGLGDRRRSDASRWPGFSASAPRRR